MRKHSTGRLAIALATFSLALAACGSSTETTDDTTGVTGGGMNMCAEGVTDCNDMGGPDGSGDPFATCPVGTPDCNDADLGGDSPMDCETSEPECNDTPTSTGDERMNPSISIVQSFVDPDTRSVEMSPGSVAEPFMLFLQEAMVDGNQVTVAFSGSEAPCFIVDNATVTEDADMVVVTVWAGAATPDADCGNAGTSQQSVTVTLEAELGSRLLLDGSRMQGADNA